MRASHRLPSVALVAALTVSAIGLEAEGTANHGPAQVDVLLSVPEDLPRITRQSMMDEADGIWRDQGITLNWLPPTAVRAVDPNRLRVVILQRRLITDPAQEAVAIGELLRPQTGHAVAVVSMDAARHLVSSVTNGELAAVNERRLGKVLGRVVAHEIGHYLLDTPTHARSGLMRPNFDATEFTDLRDGAFALDRVAAAWLRTRNVDKFAY